MPWFRVDDAFPEHRKVLALGDIEPFAIALWLKAGCLSNRSLLEGRIDLRTLRSLLDTSAWTLHGQPVSLLDVVGALARVGLWHLDGDAVVFHDYHDKQPTRDQVLAERAAGSARKIASRARLASVSGETRPMSRIGLASVSPPPVPVPEHITNTPLPPPRGGGVGETRMAALEVIDGWNRITANTPLPSVPAAAVGADGLRRISEVLKELSLADLDAMFKRVASSGWCRGDNAHSFVANFWWVLKHRLEVQAGQYDSRSVKPGMRGGGGKAQVPPTSSAVIDPDYNGAPHRFHCSHTPRCTRWPECRDREAAAS